MANNGDFHADECLIITNHPVNNGDFDGDFFAGNSPSSFTVQKTTKTYTPFGVRSKTTLDKLK